MSTYMYFHNIEKIKIKRYEFRPTNMEAYDEIAVCLIDENNVSVEMKLFVKPELRFPETSENMDDDKQ